MKHIFTASVWREDNWFIAQAHEIDIASQGETEPQALSNLREALELHYEDSDDEVAHKVHTLEVDIEADISVA